ncbi:MAG: hypothetical protein SGARI_000590, partial [Bacillariaceae sp.]
MKVAFKLLQLCTYPSPYFLFHVQPTTSPAPSASSPPTITCAIQDPSFGDRGLTLVADAKIDKLENGVDFEYTDYQTLGLFEAGATGEKPQRGEASFAYICGREPQLFCAAAYTIRTEENDKVANFDVQVQEKPEDAFFKFDGDKYDIFNAETYSWLKCQCDPPFDNGAPYPGQGAPYA